MSHPIVEVKNLSKEYNITHQQGGYIALRDIIADIFRNPFKFLKHKAKKILGRETKEEFWALRDVSFSVEKGEAIGIIGSNGAGKSTLLKILSKITPPTTGEVTLRGKVASLLEVGTGFHPELTGRENIFLNGAILGMSRKEMTKKFDEIVKFSGVEKFLDTPVKRYSSGMYVRLAFSVAAHMEPDILIVDEVLAVGDAEFQKKCLGKMDEVAQTEGRTILFVSHNMSAIQSLCKRTVLLENGRIKMIGNTKDVIDKYSQSFNTNKSNGIIVDLKNENNNIILEVSWDKYRFLPGWTCDVACYSSDGTKVFAVQSDKIPDFSSDDPEKNSIIFTIKDVGLAGRDFIFDIGIKKNPLESYNILIRGAATLTKTNKLLPPYQRGDVIIVPQISCVTKIK